MRSRNRREKRRVIACGAASLSLAIVLLGAVPAAFAQGDDSSKTSDPTPDESAFRLGRVAIECIDVDATDEEIAREEEGGNDIVVAQKSEFVLGESQERTYRIINRGEASYIRIASHTVADELVHTNGLAVTERTETASDAPLWRFAEDGFWYRSIPLEVNETITVRVSVEIPCEERWKNALNNGAKGQVTEMFDAQALQARNKTIDIESTNPWGEDGIEPLLESEVFLPEGEGSSNE